MQARGEEAQSGSKKGRKQKLEIPLSPKGLKAREGGVLEPAKAHQLGRPQHSRSHKRENKGPHTLKPINTGTHTLTQPKITPTPTHTHTDTRTHTTHAHSCTGKGGHS